MDYIETASECMNEKIVLVKSEWNVDRPKK